MGRVIYLLIATDDSAYESLGDIVLGGFENEKIARSVCKAIQCAYKRYGKAIQQWRTATDELSPAPRPAPILAEALRHSSRLSFRVDPLTIQ